MTGEVVDDTQINKESTSQRARAEKEKEKRKNKKKNQKERKRQQAEKKEAAAQAPAPKVEIEYVVENPFDDLEDPAAAEFAEIFKKLNTPQVDPSVLAAEEAAAEAAALKKEEERKKAEEKKKKEEEGDEDEEDKKPSKKQQKKHNRLSIALLKQLVKRPDVVEAWDVTSSDPKLLVYLKSQRNTIPVPRHWNQKRGYLQGKRGVEKSGFSLPDFIAATGIAQIRASIDDGNDGKKVKTKAREKLQPKLGKMDIAYEVLHDAFFRYQTKPKLTGHGDMYFEGKENELTLREKKPGVLSEELKRALGMPEGSPPPWLFAMQRIGPPPAYPNLKIPGLNAPLPENSRYGFHPGGWGKPPVDEFGRPLYGDPFGIAPRLEDTIAAAPVDRKHWGEMEEQQVPTIEDQGEGEEEGEGAAEGEEEAAADESGIETPSGFITPSGVETPEVIQLRKAPTKRVEEEDDSGKQLYQVIAQQEMTVGGALMGSTHKYIVPSSERRELKNKGNTVDLMRSQAGERMEVTLDASEVENLEGLSEEKLLKKYQQAKQDKQTAKEDVSDILRENLKKRKKQNEASDKSKKYKDFKF